MSSTTRDIASAAEGVLRSVDETSTAAGEISFAIEHATTSLDSLTESTCKSASAMEEISASVKNVEQSAALSHRVSMQVKSQADEGRLVLSETAEALAEIQRAVDFSHKGIMRLSENSTRIDSIVNVINDITKRTNLLALNAFSVSKEQADATRSIVHAIGTIRQMAEEMVATTSEQVRSSRETRNSVDSVAMMAHDIFTDLESRKMESASVVSELEVMKSGSS